VRRYVAFLRGVNLGPNRRIEGEKLREEFERLGFEDVSTFRASGNVVFGVEGKDREAALRERIEARLEEGCGFPVTVFLRSDEEVAAIAASKPFDPETLEASKGKLQVSLLMRRPSATARKKILALATDDDLLAIERRELYWLPSGGTIDSTLDLKAIERIVGPDTRRTMGTIEQMAKKYLET